MARVTRRALLQSGAVAAVSASVLSSRSIFGRSAASEVSLGYISCGGRSRELMNAFDKVEGVRTVALCDPDSARLGTASERYPDAATYADLRGLLDNSDVDAVVISTCNHWHCLAAIWAMAAGKDVYVEKPLSHSQWEGRQAVAAAEKYGKICQLGTQQRSDPMQTQIKAFLHEEQALGKIQHARVNRFGVREPIGRRANPLAVGDSVDMNLWLGPAQESPLYRDKLQYDWHWVWNTGSGEMGNWGVHVLDDLRNNVLLDATPLPSRVFAAGGRVLWNDAGETPNLHFAYFDAGDIPVVMGLANITASPESGDSPAHPGPGSGYIAYCEGGRLEGQRGRAVAFDADGKQIKRFRGTSGMGAHQQNFIDAVRSRDAASLAAPVSLGNDSTGWCNVANLAFEVGGEFSETACREAAPDCQPWQDLLDEMRTVIRAQGVRPDALQASGMLTIDSATQEFRGDGADAANALLKREYRAPFVVPEIVA